MASKKMSEFDPKGSMADADQFPILDSADGDDNKRTTKAAAFADYSKTADLGSAAFEPTSAFDAAGTGASEAASAVSGHESTYAHANLPTTSQKAALTAAATASGANPFATINDLPANELTPDELAAITGANAPSAGNVFLTEADGGGGASTLDDLTDVNAAGASDGDIIVFRAGSDWVLEAKPASGTNPAAADVSVSFTPGHHSPRGANVEAHPVAIDAAFGDIIDWTVYYEPARITIRNLGLSNATEMGADLVGTDSFLVYDQDSVSGNLRASISRIWDYVEGEITASTALPLGGYVEKSGTITFAADATLPIDGGVYELTLTGDITGFLTSGTAPSASTIYISQDANGSRLCPFPGAWKWPDGTAFIAPSTPSAVFELSLRTDPSGNIYASAAEMS